MNVREHKKIDEDFLKVQDEFLKGISMEKGIVDVDSLERINLHNDNVPLEIKDKSIYMNNDIKEVLQDILN